MNLIMGFSKYLMGFPGYYGAWLLNKHSLVYFENISVREGNNITSILHIEKWGMEKLKKSYFQCLFNIINISPHPPSI